MNKSKNKAKTKKHIDPTPSIIHPHAAGIDVGARELYVAVAADRSQPCIRTFGSFTADLNEMASWLKKCGIKTVAMESTGVYWIPAFEILEAEGIEVCLVNARHAKGVPGRKTDVQDCQWLQQLHSFGLLRPSFHPDGLIRKIRTLSRSRRHWIEQSATAIQMMKKALTIMNFQIQHVLSDLTGASGMALMDAILEGERDPQKLLLLVSPLVKATPETLIKSLKGSYDDALLFQLQQSLDLYRYLQTQILELDKKIQSYLLLLEPKIQVQTTKTWKAKKSDPKTLESFDWPRHLNQVFGVDLTQIPGISLNTALSVLSEVGPDLRKFSTYKHFCSWLKLCPNRKITGGRVLSSRTRPQKGTLAIQLRLAAQTLHFSKSALGDLYRRFRARQGPVSAITTLAHKLARIIYTMITQQKPYDESLIEKSIHHSQSQKIKSIQKIAKTLGYQLVPTT